VFRNPLKQLNLHIPFTCLSQIAVPLPTVCQDYVIPYFVQLEAAYAKLVKKRRIQNVAGVARQDSRARIGTAVSRVGD